MSKNTLSGCRHTKVSNESEEDLWECSSVDDAPASSGAGNPLKKSKAHRGDGSEKTRGAADKKHTTTTSTTNVHHQVSTDEFPTIADAEKRLDNGIHCLQETLLEHDRELLTREETLLALTREAKVWKQRTSELQAQFAQMRLEKEDLQTHANEQLDSTRMAYIAEVEALRNSKNHAESQFQRLVIDYDEVRQQLSVARRQARELEAHREEANSVVASLQRRLQEQDVSEKERKSVRSQEQHSTQQKLESLRSKFDSLERLCETLRHEKNDIEKQARQAMLELHDLRSKKEHRVLVDAEELYDKEQQLLRMEEQLQASHLNNARLLRLMAECSELHDVVRFNEITQDFVFVGYHNLTGETAVDPRALEPPRGATEGDALKLATAGARELKAPTGGAFGVISGKGTTTNNAYLRKASRNPVLNGVPNAMRQLHDAIQDENEFLHRHGIKLSTVTGGSANHAAVPPPSTNLLECKSHEKFYWIPRAVLSEAQDFKQAYFPKLALGVFFPFLVRLNQIWRQREQHLVHEAKRRQATSATRQRGGSVDRNNTSHQRGSYEQETMRRMEDDLVSKELEALRREVRLRVSSRVAQQLCKQYDHLAKLQIQKRVQLERQFEDLATIHNHTLADRAPETVAMQSHLRTISDTVRSLSHHVASKLVGSSTDIRRFLTSLEAASTRSGLAQNGVVSASVVKQLLDCVKDFSEEVRIEANVTTDSLRRIADAADRAATEIPPAGYQLHEVAVESENAAAPHQQSKHKTRTATTTAWSDDEAGSKKRSSGTPICDAYDDLVDDVVLDRAKQRRF